MQTHNHGVGGGVPSDAGPYINHPFWGVSTPYFWKKTPMSSYPAYHLSINSKVWRHFHGSTSLESWPGRLSLTPGPVVFFWGGKMEGWMMKVNPLGWRWWIFETIFVVFFCWKQVSHRWKEEFIAWSLRNGVQFKEGQFLSSLLWSCDIDVWGTI